MFPVKLLCILIICVIINEGECKKDFTKELGSLAEAIGNLYGAVDDCKYKCSQGDRPKVNKNHKPSANGCGSYGLTFKIDSVPGATKCCDSHDYCYDTCNKDKALCDRQLKQCLQDICNGLDGWIDDKKMDECDNVVKIIFGGVAAVGCDAYLKAQKSACTCPAPQHHSQRGYRQPHRHTDV